MDKLLTETEVKKEIAQTQNSAAENAQKQTSAAEINVQSAPPQNSYISSFKNVTIADIKKEEEEKLKQQAAQDRALLQDQFIEAQESEAQTRKGFEGLSARKILFPQKYLKEEPMENAKEENVQQAECDFDTATENAADENKNVLDSTDKAASSGVIEKPNYDLLEANKKVIKLKKQTSPKKQRSKKLAGLALACALGGAAIICVTNCVILDQMNSAFLQLEDSYKLNLAKYLRDISNLDATKNSMEMLETYPDELLDAGDLGQKSNWFDRLCNFIGGMFGG